MDYLNPHKELRDQVTLMVGYVLVALAIAIGAIILLYKAYGFGIGKNGAVIQSGLTFFSSQPNPARIYTNGRLEPVSTNTRLSLPAGIYHVKLSRDGYRDWQRTIELEGGSVEHFDYPFLIPKTLTPVKLRSFTAPPGLATQSPDRRWLMMEQPDSVNNFDVYDLKSPAKPPLNIVLPTNLLSQATTSQTWQLVEWADDNRHVLLQHVYDGKTEFVLADRTNGDQAVNLNKALSANLTSVSLRNKKYDQYYVYDKAAATLAAASLKSPSVTTLLQHVLAYKSYGDSQILYVSNAGAPAGKVVVKLRAGNRTLTIRDLVVGSTYLIDLTEYNGVMYVAAGNDAGNKVYIFQDPAGQLAEHPGQAVVPLQVLRVPQPNYLSFSNSAQFIVTENGSRFGTYDIETGNGYNYAIQNPLDSPQSHATWMDGDRLTLTSGGKLIIFDYDGTNQQVLVPASAAYLPVFAPDYKNLYTLASTSSTGQLDLTQTSLLIPADR